MPEQAAVKPWLASIRLELAAGVKLDRTDGKWTITQGGRVVSFVLPPGEVSEALSQIRKDGIFLDSIAETGNAQSPALSEQLGRLWHQGLLTEVIYQDGRALASLHNFGIIPVIPRGVATDDELIMTEDACIRRQNDSLVIESVACGAYLEVSKLGLLGLPAAITGPIRCGDWARAAMAPEDVVIAIASCLQSIGALKNNELPAAIMSPSLGWSFADRMMHARSRLGRHVGGYGGTCRFRGRVLEPPALPETGNRPKRQLPRPDLGEITQHDPPFTEVLEKRRSIREHGNVPLSEAKLSEFLYRTSRITGLRRSNESEVISRPYPSGGGLYELEVYPLVNRCEGLSPGLYRYDGSTHSLEYVAAMDPDGRQLVDDARAASRMRGEPHVLLLLAARFMRVNWKYESVAYSLILKNVGVLQQTMYLVATAMGLAACALGGGNSDVFCRLAGTDFWHETTVGEFLLGEKGADAAEDRPA